MNKGFLISFEGGEGGGKTTQIALLREKLEAAGHQVITLREPGGTEVGEQVRDLVLSNKYKNLAFSTEVLLFQAGRAQIYAEKVLPALKNGMVVLIDRTRDSSVVYQGVVRGFGTELIEQLNTISTQNTYPDLTLLFDVPVEKGLARREGSGIVNRLDSEEISFHKQVREAYLELAKANDGGRWNVIDAAQSADEVAKKVWDIVKEKLPS